MGLKARFGRTARGLMILAALSGGIGPAAVALAGDQVAAKAGDQVTAVPNPRDGMSGEFDLLLSRSLGAIRAAALRDLELETAPVQAELVGRADRYVDWVFDWGDVPVDVANQR
jgi:hypothetical protein